MFIFKYEYILCYHKIVHQFLPVLMINGPDVEIALGILISVNWAQLKRSEPE